jgi:Na+/proline symporter
VFVLVAAGVVLLLGLPSEVHVRDALRLAGSTGRLDALDFRFTLNETYTFWSGLLGGLFLMLSYFGCDQSQVQRYLTAKSVDEGRSSLMMSAYWKIPLQLLVLMVGVLTFTFYLFQRPPMLFNKVHEQSVRASDRAAEYAALEDEFGLAFEGRRQAASDLVIARRSGDGRAEAQAVESLRARDAAVAANRGRPYGKVRQTTGDASYTDVNYVFPTFIVTALPIGLVGLWIAAIITAATDTIAAELNSLATATVIDVYQRLYNRGAPDEHYLRVSKMATAFW